LFTLLVKKPLGVKNRPFVRAAVAFGLEKCLADKTDPCQTSEVGAKWTTRLWTIAPIRLTSEAGAIIHNGLEEVWAVARLYQLQS